MDQRLVFMHIERSGGSTMNYILGNNFTPHFIDVRCFHAIDLDQLLDTATHSKRLCLSGHFTEGAKLKLWSKMNFSTFDIVTFIRHPIKRLISHYFWGMSNGPRGGQQYPFYKKLKKESITLEQYVAKELEKHVSNHLTKVFSDMNSFSDHTRQCTREDLKRAIDNFTEFVTSFGIVESFDASLELMKAELCLEDISYIRQNERNLEGEVSRDALNGIEAKNAFDMEFYEFAKNLFEKRLKERKSLSRAAIPADPNPAHPQPAARSLR